jgi:rhodanese-related sulfurtransferase
VAPLDLAAWIRDRRPGLRVIDLREGLDSTAYLIPGAEPVPLARVPALNISVSQPVVLYSDGGTNAAQAWVLLRARGITNVYVLKDGMAAWEDEVLSPHPSTVPDDSAVARFDRARALSLWFGGKPSAERRAPSTRPLRPIRRRNTC